LTEGLRMSRRTRSPLTRVRPILFPNRNYTESAWTVDVDAPNPNDVILRPATLDHRLRNDLQAEGSIMASARESARCANSIPGFGITPHHSLALQQTRAVSTDRSGGHGASQAIVHILRGNGWTTMIRRIHEGWSDARRQRRARFLLMTQLVKPSGAEDGVSSPTGYPAKKFRCTQLIPSLQPLVDEPGANVVAATPRGGIGRRHAPARTLPTVSRSATSFVCTRRM
jgi:hypothetical protein